MEKVIRNAFGDCKYIATCLCENKSSFELINEEEFYVSDQDEDQPVRVSNLEDYELKVGNTTESHICLIKTDKCLFTDKYSKCDCILLNASKLFLVEIKNSSAGSRNKHRNKAVDQLSSTIELLSNNGISLEGVETKAIICFKRNDSHPVRASLNSQRAIFQKKYGISLEEGNYIQF